MFRVGQKVVCVYTFPDESAYPFVVFPQKGEVYTIRALVARHRGDGVLLTEIVNAPFATPLDGFGEPAFVRRAFRPVVERKTDISIFKRMLTDTRETA